MKYKILYHMLKTVKASLKSGGAEGDLTPEEIEKLTIDEIKEHLKTVKEGEYGNSSMIGLIKRLDQLQEEAVKKQIPEGGLNALDLDTIIRLEEEAPFLSDIRIELCKKRVELEEAVLMQKIPGGDVNGLTDIDQIINLMGTAPYDGNLWKSLHTRLEDRITDVQSLTKDQIESVLFGVFYPGDQESSLYPKIMNEYIRRMEGSALHEAIVRGNDIGHLLDEKNTKVDSESPLEMAGRLQKFPNFRQYFEYYINILSQSSCGACNSTVEPTN